MIPSSRKDISKKSKLKVRGSEISYERCLTKCCLVYSEYCPICFFKTFNTEKCNRAISTPPKYLFILFKRQFTFNIVSMVKIRLIKIATRDLKQINNTLQVAGFSINAIQ